MGSCGSKATQISSLKDCKCTSGKEKEKVINSFLKMLSLRNPRDLTVVDIHQVRKFIVREVSLRRYRQRSCFIGSEWGKEWELKSLSTEPQTVLCLECRESKKNWWVPLIGEIIWYLSFTAWCISLSIVLSSSTHAVALYLNTHKEKKKEKNWWGCGWQRRAKGENWDNCHRITIKMI